MAILFVPHPARASTVERLLAGPTCQQHDPATLWWCGMAQKFLKQLIALPHLAKPVHEE